MVLYISNLGRQITRDSLEAVFSTYGAVQHLRVLRTASNGTGQGYAFVYMPDKLQAELALLKINGVVLDGQTVSVRQADDRMADYHSELSKSH